MVIKKKTIFMTVNRALIVRNLLLSSAFREFEKKYNIVIFSCLANDPEFRNKFAGYKIELLQSRPLSRWNKSLEQLFISIHKSLIYNPTIQVRSEYGLTKRAPVRFKRLRNGVEKYFFGKFLSYNLVRILFKKLDAFVFPCSVYDKLIEKYSPELVFITAMGSDDEVAFLRNCKKKGVKSVGMAMSWDNLSKFGFRDTTDKFIVWSEYMSEEAVSFQCYKSDQLQIVGIPQFDYYQGTPVITSEEFRIKFGLDLDKKIILFGSDGSADSDDPYVVQYLRDKIVDGILGEYQILVRPHFAFTPDVERFVALVDNKNVFIDNFREYSNFKDGTSLTLNTVQNLKSEICYADVVVTSASTLALDVAANGKIPILYNFDKDKFKPYRDSGTRFYDTLWFREILKIGIDNMANSEEDLVQKIKDFTMNSIQEEEKRLKLIERFCYKVDGKSGKRLFDFIDRILELKKG